MIFLELYRSSKYHNVLFKHITSSALKPLHMQPTKNDILSCVRTLLRSFLILDSNSVFTNAVRIPLTFTTTMKTIKKVLLFGILSLGTSSFALDADAIAKGGRTLLQNHGGADVIGVVSQSNENVKMPSRSALLEAVQQHRGAHLRGRQPSSLSQVHDLKSANNNLVVEDSSRLGVSKESQQLTDHIIIVSGGRTHFGVNHGDNRDLQVSLPAGLVPTGSNEGSSVEAATTDIPSDSPSMAPTEKCYSIDLSFETDGDAAALSFVMYNLLDLDDGVLNQTIIGKYTSNHVMNSIVE
jgi:hypothetical protein